MAHEFWLAADIGAARTRASRNRVRRLAVTVRDVTQSASMGTHGFAMAQIAVACLAGLSASVAHAQAPQSAAPHPGFERIQADASPDARAEWDRKISRMIRTGSLRLRDERKTEPATRDQWFVQLHKGVPVEGTEVWRQLDGRTTLSIEGSLYKDITIDPVPRLTRAEAQVAFQALAPDRLTSSRAPELVVLPIDGTYLLTYKARVFLGTGLATHYVDANTGRLVRSDAAPGPP